MRIRILLIFFILTQFALFSQVNEIRGITYESLDESITLNNDGTFVYKVAHCDICPSFGESDTVSYGRYVKHKNRFYYLFSSPDINGSEMSISVEEAIVMTKDSLVIELLNPFEIETIKSPYLRSAIFYQIVIYYDIDSVKKLIDINDPVVLSRLGINTRDNNVCSSLPQTVWSNKLTIYKPTGFPITHIYMGIYPTTNYRINHPFLWSKYHLENPYSNYLKICIPQFTYQYFCYEYFHYKEIEIISSKAIGMDGILFWESDVFKKLKASPKKKHVNWRYRLWEIKDPYEEERNTEL